MRRTHHLLPPGICRASVSICVGLTLSCFAILPLSSVSQRRQSPQSIEAENLISSARASSGQFSRQDMSGFGRGWGGNAQLFWTPPPPVDRPIRNWPNLTLSFNAPSADTYELVLHYTSAPDFAMFRVFVDGQPAADIDGYSPGVSLASRSLGKRRLSGGSHQLVVTVYSKARNSRGFSVGLDRLEFRSVDAGTTENTNPGRPDPRRNPPDLSRPGAATAQLNFALISGITQKWTEKGGTEKPLDRTNLFAHFVWQSSAGDQLVWRWQVARQPFSGPVTLSPAGLVKQQEVSARTFAIDFGGFPPLNAVKGSGPSRQASIDLFIRMVATANGQPISASNVVVAHYLPGSDSSNEITNEAFENAEKEKKKLEELKKAYSVEVISFKPAMFANPNKWGCVYIVKNSSSGFFNAYPPGEHCGKSYKGQSYQASTPWDYITGWSKAYDVVSGFYDDAKKWTAHQFAQALPCEQLGKAGSACEKYSEELAGVAINVGLAAAGVPPSLPNLSNLAKGQVVDAGVAFTCTTIEDQGGQCSPKLRDALKKAYGAGLDRLAKNLDKVTKEPGCGNEKEAHEHGREPLPCFGDNPDIEFRAADGAVYQPPMVSLRITRNSSLASNFTETELQTTIWLKNRFPGGQIESYHQPVPPTDLAGELFAPISMTLPSLGPGQSVNLVLPMGGIKQYTFSSTKGGYAVHNGWCALYKGGTASISSSIQCRTSSGKLVHCGGSERTVKTPNDANCSL